VPVQKEQTFRKECIKETGLLEKRPLDKLTCKGLVGAELKGTDPRRKKPYKSKSLRSRVLGTLP